MEDKYLRILSVFEQAGAFMQIFANFLGTYHKSLVESGFQRDEALRLVKGLQTDIFHEAMKMSADTETEEE